MTFEELLARAAEPTLQWLVGRPGGRLLARLDPGLTQPERLREGPLGLKTPQEMVLDPATRAELLTLLPRTEAAALATAVGVDGTGDPFRALDGMRVARRSARASALLDFFALAEPETDPPPPPTIQEVHPAHGLFGHQRLA